jgi:imidazolonepropionase-like amidohydrolase
VGEEHSISLPESAQAVEHSFPQCTILPGLIDVHTHLSMPGDGRGIIEVMGEPDEDLILRAAKNAGTALRSGVTTLRDNGGRNKTIFSLRKALSNGYAEGPRLNVCGWPITITMGHCYPMGGEADGVDGVRRAVRRVIGEGADYIKVMASGGETPSSFPYLPSFTPQELKTIVDEAHHFGKLVAMHCTCARAVLNALEAGADMLVHCLLRDPDSSWKYHPEMVERIARAEVWVNPTFQVSRSRYWALKSRAEKEEASQGLDAELAAAKENWETRVEIFRRMIREGIKVVAGGDTGWGYARFGDFFLEIEAMLQVGLSPMQAIQTATRDAAESIGLGDTAGTIETGKEADILVIEGDPLEDIMNIGKVKAVFRSGRRIV